MALGPTSSASGKGNSYSSWSLNQPEGVWIVRWPSVKAIRASLAFTPPMVNRASHGSAAGGVVKENAYAPVVLLESGAFGSLSGSLSAGNFTTRLAGNQVPSSCQPIGLPFS